MAQTKKSLLLALCCLLVFCAEISRKHKHAFILCVQTHTAGLVWPLLTLLQYPKFTMGIYVCSPNTEVNASIFLFKTKLLLCNQSVKQSQLKS